MTQEQEVARRKVGDEHREWADRVTSAELWRAGWRVKAFEGLGRSRMCARTEWGARHVKEHSDSVRGLWNPAAD